MTEIIVLFTVSFLGCIIQGVTGFGFAIVTMAVLPLFLPYKTSVITVALLSLLMTTQLSFRLRKYIQFKMLVPALVASITGRTLGVYIVMKIDPSILKAILGVILVLVSIWLLLISKQVKIKPSIVTGATAGFISGILGGMSNVGGPPLAVYYYSALNEKREYNATIQATFAISGIYTVLLYAFYGSITQEVVKLSATGLISVILGTSLRLMIFYKINREVLGRVICIFVLVMGFVMLGNGLHK